MRAALISIPKSGTNLVVALLNEACPDAPLIDLMYPEPMVNGQSPREYSMRSMVHARRVLETTGGRALFHSHMVFTDYLQTTLWEFGIPPIFLIRDPRAVAVSFVDYVLKETDHPAHTYFRTQLPNMASRLAVTIRGTDPEDTSLPFVPSIKTAWTRYVRWRVSPRYSCCATKGWSVPSSEAVPSGDRPTCSGCSSTSGSRPTTRRSRA